jgi:two-component system cell cycle response regulator
MKNAIKILIIEDNAADARLIKEMLQDVETATFESEWVDSLSKGLKRLSETPFDALLLDLGLPDSAGIETLEKILSEAPGIPVIVLTGLADEMTGVEAVHKGAQDYLVKGPVNSDVLIRSIRYSIERKRMMKELHDLSILDDMTGLYNRRGFFALAEQQIKIAERDKGGLWFIVADLDGLKEINDTFGHEEGDLAIKDTATILKETFREADIIGRLGGDEFAIVASEKTPANIGLISDRIGNKIDSLEQKSKRPYKLSISIGMAHCLPQAPCSIDEVLAAADRLMYQQKRNKKSPVHGLPKTG